MLRFIYGLTAFIGVYCAPIHRHTQNSQSLHHIRPRKQFTDLSQKGTTAGVQPYMLGRGREFCHGLTPFLPRQ